MPYDSAFSRKAGYDLSSPYLSVLKADVLHRLLFVML